MADARARIAVKLVDPTTNANEAGVSAAGNLNVAVNLALPAGANNIGAVDTELPAAAALTDNFANPTAPGVGAFLMGWDGTTWDRVKVNASGDLVVTTGGAPTLAKVDTLTSVALAAGTAISLNGTQVTSTKTGKLAAVTASASVPLKIEVRTALNGAFTNRIVLFSRANEPVTFVTPHKDYITQAESVTAGFDGFNLNITNMDNSAAADVYGTILWDEV